MVTCSQLFLKAKLLRLVCQHERWECAAEKAIEGFSVEESIRAPPLMLQNVVAVTLPQEALLEPRPSQKTESLHTEENVLILHQILCPTPSKPCSI